MADDLLDPSAKLAAAPKKSLFERQKAEAEAKKAREKAETAAVYEDFVKSFDEDGNTPPSAPQNPSRQSGQATGTFSAAPGKRHFTSSGLKSGPGSLGSTHGGPKTGFGSLGPAPSSHGRKRQYDDFQGRHDRERVFAYEDERPGYEKRDQGVTFDDEARESSKVAAKPTLHLSSLPPGTSPSVIRALLTPSPLAVEDVRILVPSAPSATTNGERKSTSAIVTLAAETPATDIDTVVSHLQNKYLGLGFHLSISRHLSSVALSGPAAISASGIGTNNLPFGAKTIVQHSSLSRAPPPGQNRFAPPAAYTSSMPYDRTGLPPTQVTVQPPSDLKQLKLVHKTLEALLTYGPEFEALLMSRPQIQRDEKWSWLWDSRSVGGVYYRWRLWDILTNGSHRRRNSQYQARNPAEILFEGQSSWVPPGHGLMFEYTTKMDEFVSDNDYNSSDEEAENDGGMARRYNDHNKSAPAIVEADIQDGGGYLNPLVKAKLVHLLKRLPESNAKLRRGDVARLTGFAIEHAGAGADEVAQLITRNVVEPFRIHKNGETSDQEDDVRTPNDHNAIKGEATIDKSPSSLVGLDVISDILSTSASAGVRHAWRYRSLFETQLRQQKIFAKLGRLDRDLGWGKLKADKWRRSVQSILSLWEGWSVFPHTSHEEFAEQFLNPPLTEKEKKTAEAEQQSKDAELKRSKNNGKWRSVEDERAEHMQDVNMDDVDGVARVDEDDDLKGKPTESDLQDLDGVPMADSSDEEGTGEKPTETSSEDPNVRSLAPTTIPEENDQSPSVPKSAVQMPSISGPGPKRQRPRAVDMFADDSDG